MELLDGTFRLVLSCVIGIFIGIDQKHRGKEAGPKTHSLVCLGSTLAVLAGTYMGGEAPARIAAQVVTGIGFLGAGVILVRKNYQIQGLTTAAGIWLVASLGIIVATDGWPLALVAAACWFLITHFFTHYGDKKEGEEEEDNGSERI